MGIVVTRGCVTLLNQLNNFDCNLIVFFFYYLLNHFFHFKLLNNCKCCVFKLQTSNLESTYGFLFII
jgi:hypothetical protein